MLGDEDALRARLEFLRAIDRHESLIRLLESRDDIEQRRLAAAGGTDNGDQLPVAHAEADPLQHR